MNLYVLALRSEPNDPHAWLEQLPSRSWLTVGLWTFQEPPVAVPTTIPCLVPAAVRDHLQLIDCEDKAFGQWIVAEHKPDKFEVRHFRQIANGLAPLPCGGVFPWERVAFRVPKHMVEIATGFVHGPHDVRDDLLLVGPEDATGLLELLPSGLVEWVGLAEP
jgi:hypothetical protein